MYFLYVLLFLFQNNTPKHVIEYHSITNKNSELAFINKYKSSTKVSVQAYVISLEMKQAEYKLFPWQKLKIFNKGKQKLEQLIIENEKNADLRYIRLVIQEQLPKLLNYSSEIENDKLFLSELLKIKDSTDYLDPYIKNNTTL